MPDGQVGQDLPVDGDSGFAEHPHEAGVGYPLPVYTGPDPRYPESAEIPFSQLTPPVGLRLRAHDGFPGGSM